MLRSGGTVQGGLWGPSVPGVSLLPGACPGGIPEPIASFRFRLGGGMFGWHKVGAVSCMEIWSLSADRTCVLTVGVTGREP